MTSATVRLTAALAVVLAAACNRSSVTVADDLQRDLDLASPSGVSLAPTGGRVDVVSSIEQGKTAAAPAPKETALRAVPKRVASVPHVAVHAPAPTPAPVAEAPAPAPTPEPRVIAQAPVDEPAPTVTPAPDPVPLPRPSPAPRGRQRGGTWTMGDVMRNAPFPITP